MCTHGSCVGAEHMLLPFPKRIPILKLQQLSVMQPDYVLHQLPCLAAWLLLGITDLGTSELQG